MGRTTTAVWVVAMCCLYEKESRWESDVMIMLPGM